MKITYLAPSIIPSRSANSIHVMKMCQAFAKNGHEVTLIVPNRKDEMEKDVEDVFGFYGVERCFRIEMVKWYKVRGQDQLYGLTSALKARRIKPDLVYSRIVGGAFFAARFGLPVIFEVHTPANYGSRVSSFLFSALSYSAKLVKVVAITNALKDYFETTYPRLTGKIQIAPDGADPVVTDWENEPANPARVFTVGYVGHLYKGRGIDIIIRLAEACPWAEFHLVGGTAGDLEFWRSNTNLTNLHFHGFVPPAEAIKMLTNYDALLAPYQYSVSTAAGNDTVKWMSPLKIFEYMSTGVPIIASDLPVLREVLQHERNALLCPPTDSSAWQSSLEMLKKNPELGIRLGKNALEDFLRNYTWQGRADKVLNGLISKE